MLADGILDYFLQLQNKQAWATRFFDFSFSSSVNVIITKSRKFQEHSYVFKIFYLINCGYDVWSNIFFVEVPQKWILET